MENFKVTRSELQKALDHPLPAWEGQKRMSLFQDEYQRKKGSENAKKAAVMVVLEELRQQIIIIERASHPLDKHKGQLSFPGGQYDASCDESLMDTAVRETREEIDLHIEPQQVIGPMSPLYIPVSNFQVQPFVTMLDEVKNLTPQPTEVAEIWRLDLEVLFAHQIHKTEMRLATGMLLKDVPFYPLGEKKVWGATAMMLAELSAILKPLYYTSN